MNQTEKIQRLRRSWRKLRTLIPTIEVGKKYTFKEGNVYSFFMDFAFYKNVPSNITFTCESKANEDGYWFKGPGYGEEGNYGNGSIAIYNLSKIVAEGGIKEIK